MSLASGSNAGVLRRRGLPEGTDRKIKENPRYKHVKSTLDTGPTTKKQHIPTTREVTKRRDEIFERIRPLELYSMIVEYEEGQNTGTEGGPQIVTIPAAADKDTSKPFLLVDARDKEAYDQCHLMEAINFPAILLNRDKIDYQIMQYKNKPDCCIVIYDENESVAPSVAGKLVERGYENVYLLTGGLRVVAKKYPLLIDGEIPEGLVPSEDSSPRTARTNGQGSSVTPRHPSASSRRSRKDASAANGKLVDRINENEGRTPVSRNGGKAYSSARTTESKRPARYL
eukprot:gb/GECG01001956.1/.p1 GENE.gb/GECG01001956.1/~~gb/GECG01001956.1/.p1  ORF type:complete len:285 (+),score=27.77 gb/GECG01001956.1/:1-855(+)